MGQIEWQNGKLDDSKNRPKTKLYRSNRRITVLFRVLLLLLLGSHVVRTRLMDLETEDGWLVLLRRRREEVWILQQEHMRERGSKERSVDIQDNGAIARQVPANREGGLYTSLQHGQNSFTLSTFGLSLSPTGRRFWLLQYTREQHPKWQLTYFSIQKSKMGVKRTISSRPSRVKI